MRQEIVDNSVNQVFTSYLYGIGWDVIRVIYYQVEVNPFTEIGATHVVFGLYLSLFVTACLGTPSYIRLIRI